MNEKLSRYTEIAFRVWGWFSIASIAANVGMQIYMYLFQLEDLQKFGMVIPFFPLKQFAVSSSSFAQGTLALLVASVLQMIRLRKAEWVKGRPYRLAIATAGAFLVNGVLAILYAQQHTTAVIPTSSGPLYFYDLFRLFFDLIVLATPFLYAASVFLVYRCVADWVTLEAELA